MGKFINQNAEELAASESFQDWYFSKNNEAIEFWERWIHNNPNREKEVENAKIILSKLNFISTPVSQHQIDNSWDKLSGKIQRIEDDFKIVAISRGSKVVKRKFNVLHIAAAVTLLIASVFALHIYTDQQSNFHHTAFGETISITLPDNSVVTLNSNSSLRYDSEWKEGQDRTVWLNGEAYFSVVHTDTDEKFHVITSDDFMIEVLGTEFNVKKRKGKTSVVLKSGKVKLNIDNPQIKEELFMQPGEFVEFKEASKSVVKKVVNPEVFISWKCKKLVFENTSLKEVILILEENYGLRVEVSDNKLLEKKVSGSVPSNNTRLLMEGLSEVFDLNIVWTKKQVKIQNRNKNMNS